MHSLARTSPIQAQPGLNQTMQRVQLSTLLVRLEQKLMITLAYELSTANATGSGWEAAFAQASHFVSQLTLQEKTQLVTGTTGPCVGNIGSIPRLDFEGLCLQDGPLAIRQADYASVFPAGLTVAASWDKRLAHVRGQQLGSEFKDKGANVMLGPVAGPLGRSGYGGRNWEGFSPDPYLTGLLFEEVCRRKVW